MSSPFSIKLRSIRLQAGKTQASLAHAMGFEQAYFSSIELGIKKPSPDFLDKLIKTLQLGEAEQNGLKQALLESNRRFVLPVEVTTETYAFCHALWKKIDKLHPAHLDALRQVLDLDARLAISMRFAPDRIARRDKAAKETAM
jgi:transcriptional regulator with XRE-family HTH domain